MPERPKIRRGSRREPWLERLALGATPLVIFLAHLASGANQSAAALWFTFMLAALLTLALTVPSIRTDLAGLRFLSPLIGAFAAVLLCAALSQTAFAPGGPNPVWDKAGFAPATTINRSATWIEMVKLAGLACAFAIGCLQGARTSRARRSIEIVMALGGVYAVISLVWLVTGWQVRAGPRLSGGFMSANSAATVFGMLSLIAISVTLRRWRKATPLSRQALAIELAPSALCVLLALICLTLTASRMGLASTVAAMAVFLAWDSVARRQSRLAMPNHLLALMIAGGVILATIGGLLWSRVADLEPDAANRGEIFAAHWQAFLQSPLFGYGLGAFTDINNHIMTPDNYGALWSIRAAHNVYIQWLEEAGVLGAAPMFILIALAIAVSVRRAGALQTSRTLARGLVATSIVVLLHGLTDYALQVPSISAFWAFLLGLQFAFGQRRSTSRRSKRRVRTSKQTTLELDPSCPSPLDA